MNELKTAIENASRICILTHISPDGDAVCSSLAMALACIQLGKKPYILIENYGDEFDFLNGRELIYSGDISVLDSDLCIATDCSNKERLGKSVEVFDKAPLTFNIDHHVSNEGYGKVNVVNGDASSACEVVYECIKDFVTLDKHLAEVIYTGIVTDTGGFRHASTGKRTHEIAAKLVVEGIDTSFIYSTVLMEHSYVQAKVLARAIENSSFDGIVSTAYILVSDMEELGADRNDLGAVVDYILNITGTRVAIFAYERKDGLVKLSFRSKSVNVNEIASLLGGGGHDLAAGALVEGMDIHTAIKKAKDMVYDKI